MEYSLNFKRTSKRYNKNDLFNNIEKVWKHLKKQPTVKDMDLFPSEISFGTYFNHFGSWKIALEEFVKLKNNGTLVENKNKIISKEKRITLNKSLRFDVMKKDNFKCRLCGLSPANNHKVELQIDHIIPISKG